MINCDLGLEQEKEQGEAAFRCDYKHIPTAEGFFKHFVIPATWADARLRCSLEGATLASPLNPNIEAEMKHIIQIYFTSESEIFTGFHATISQGNFYSIEGTPLSEISLAWAENEPNNVGNNENCITFNANGEMADRSCNEPRPYICFRSAEIKTEVNECGTIDSEYKLDQRTNSCYKFHTVPRTFSGAHFACSAEGGHLAIINSNVEATVLRELFAKYPSGTMFGSFRKDFAFVGFHDWGETADWRTIHEAAFRCDYKYSSEANGWFKHYLIPATWADAHLRCALQGAKLASPLNDKMVTEMKIIMQKFFNPDSEIFTGFHATFSRGNFYSTEGVPLSGLSLPWAEKEPDNVGNNENCITLNVDGEMADRSCDEPRPYICFRSADTKTEVNECGTIDPGLTLTETGYNKFSPGEPSNSTPGEFCGSIYRSALLNDLWCERPAAFICEKKRDFPPVC
ncbi:unnamed protein product [Spodoptera exigua]|nr:unnamed protein product [Spodoptera exigua]